MNISTHQNHHLYHVMVRSCKQAHILVLGTPSIEYQYAHISAAIVDLLNAWTRCNQPSEGHPTASRVLDDPTNSLPKTTAMPGDCYQN